MEEEQIMADRLLNSLKLLAEERRGLEGKERQLKRLEMQFVGNLGRLLSKAGYRLVPMNGQMPRHSSTSAGGTTVKRIHCPHCDRRFGRPLHLARHMSAIHGKKKAGARK
jgi:hypothetical protein